MTVKQDIKTLEAHNNRQELCCVPFSDEDFTIFQNMVYKNKYYYYAEKDLGDYVIEVNGGKYKVHFDIEIVNNKYRNVIARGSYKNLNDLNVDLEKWIKANLNVVFTKASR